MSAMVEGRVVRAGVPPCASEPAPKTEPGAGTDEDVMASLLDELELPELGPEQDVS